MAQRGECHGQRAWRRGSLCHRRSFAPTPLHTLAQDRLHGAMLPAILAALILTNGKIWTGDASMAAAMAIEGNRIIAVGSNATIAKLTTVNDQVIDLRGAARKYPPLCTVTRLARPAR